MAKEEAEQGEEDLAQAHWQRAVCGADLNEATVSVVNTYLASGIKADAKELPKLVRVVRDALQGWG